MPEIEEVRKYPSYVYDCDGDEACEYCVHIDEHITFPPCQLCDKSRTPVSFKFNGDGDHDA